MRRCKKYHALIVIFEQKKKQKNLKFKIMTAADNKFWDIFLYFRKK